MARTNRPGGILPGSHWYYPREAGDLNERLGFVYVITNKLDGRRYFGRKQFWVRKSKQWVASDWNFYTGSSELLLADVDACGKANFSFDILAIFNRKSGIAVGEATAILSSGSLLAPERFYNRAAPSVRGKISITDSDREELEHLIQWLKDNT